MTTISTFTVISPSTPPPAPTRTTASPIIATTTSPITTTQCIICTGTIKRKSTNVLQKTKHSATPIFIFLNKILNEPLLLENSAIENEKQFLPKPTQNTEIIDKIGLCCRSCVIKINNYDKALLTAEQIQREIQQIYKKKFDKTVKNEYNKFDNEQDYATENNISLLETPSTTFVVQKTKLKNIKTEHIVTNDDYDSDDDDDEDDDDSYHHENLQEYEECEQKSQLEKILCSPSVIKINHESLDSKLKIIESDEEFSNKMELNDRIKKKHRNIDKKINKNNLVCHICGQIYKSKASLLVHSRLHTAVSNIHQCKFCGKKFAQKAALARHIPIHTGESLYQCDKCGKQYIHYSSFHMHQQAHDGIREKKCSICGLQLRSSSHLSRHMRVHSGEKPYACPTCGQRFAQRYNMTVHYKAHQGIHRLQTRSYVCLICQIRFQTQSKLAEHLSVKHNSVANLSNSLNTSEQNCERISTDLIDS